MTTERRRGRAAVAALDVPDAIHWKEGMLLAPPHFQQLAYRHESLVAYHAAAISPFHWGIRRLEIDESLLAGGTYRITELEAVMPDGLLITHTPKHPPLSVELGDFQDTLRSRPAKVHLAIAARFPNVKVADRYTQQDGGFIADDLTGQGEVPMPQLRPRLQLLPGDVPPPTYVSFPLAEITYGNEGYARTRFEPPSLQVAPRSALYELCLGVAARLREKATFLADQVRSPSAAARTPQILDTKWQVHCLVGELPAFEALLRSAAAHPFTLYVAFCSVLGHVAGLGRTLLPAALEPYDHNDPMTSFKAVRDAVWTAVHEGIHESYASYPFVLQGDEFRIHFDEAWRNRALVLGVRAKSGTPETEVDAWVGASVIGAEAKILGLRERRVTGIKRKRIDADADLVPSRGVTLYSIAHDQELLAPGKDLVIVNPGEEGRHRPEEIVLYVRHAS